MNKTYIKPLLLLSLGALLCSSLITSVAHAAPGRRGQQSSQGKKRSASGKTGKQASGKQASGKRASGKQASGKGQGQHPAQTDRQVQALVEKFLDENNRSGWTCWTNKLIQTTKNDARYKALIADLQKIKQAQNPFVIGRALQSHRAFIESKAGRFANIPPMTLLGIVQKRIDLNKNGNCAL